jgi:predicted esterase
LSRYYLDSIAERRSQTSPKVGATWMTKEFREHEIADYVRYLDLLVADVRTRLDPSRIIVLGFSQGVATVCRWLAASNVLASELILWGGLIPPELDVDDWMTRLNGARLTFVVGNEDEFITPKVLSAEEARLVAGGVPYRLVRFAGEHAINQETLEQLASTMAGR